MNTIHMLLTAHGITIGIFATREAAEKRRDLYNANPVVGDGAPDTDAPYSVASWAVTE